MPTVPKTVEDIARGDPGLLSASRPDAASMLMAASLIHGQSRVNQPSGDISHIGPRRAKVPKGMGRTRATLR